MPVGLRTRGGSGDEPDGGLRVTGGAGGTTARIGSLREAAGRIERAAAALSDADALVRAAVGRADDGSSPVTAARLHAAAAPLTSRSRGLVVRCDQLARTAASLRVAAEVYERAEADVVGAVLRVVSTRAGYAIGELGPLGQAAVVRAVGTGVVLGGTFLVGARALRYTPTPLGLGLWFLGRESVREEDGALGYVGRMVGGDGLLPDDLGPPHGTAVEAALPGVAAAFLGALPGHVPLLDDPVRQVAAARRPRAVRPADRWCAGRPPRRAGGLAGRWTRAPPRAGGAAGRGGPAAWGPADVRQRRGRDGRGAAPRPRRRPPDLGGDDPGHAEPRPAGARDDRHAVQRPAGRGTAGRPERVGRPGDAGRRGPAGRAGAAGGAQPGRDGGDPGRGADADCSPSPPC